LTALESEIDAILRDNSASFDAGRAFDLLQAARLPIPLIVVSGRGISVGRGS
jgi:hypothetical protein